jgi:hypothetical protein
MDLVAISPVTKTVPLGRGAVEVTGLSLRKLTGLMAAYPELVPLAAGGEVNLARLLVEAPESALTIFSLGLQGAGRPRRQRLLFWRKEAAAPLQDDANLLEAFDAAPAGQQLDALGAIVDLTFKGERAIPFLKAVAAAMTRPRQEASTPPEPMPSPSDGSSGSDIPPNTSGT